MDFHTQLRLRSALANSFLLNKYFGLQFEMENIRQSNEKRTEKFDRNMCSQGNPLIRLMRSQIPMYEHDIWLYLVHSMQHDDELFSIYFFHCDSNISKKTVCVNFPFFGCFANFVIVFDYFYYATKIQLKHSSQEFFLIFTNQFKYMFFASEYHMKRWRFSVISDNWCTEGTFSLCQCTLYGDTHSLV